MLFGRTNRPDLHRTARPRFSPLSAGSSVLDALWIVAIILEQPAYALIVPSRPIRFWLLILSLQVLPQNKIKLISSEKKLPQLFDFMRHRVIEWVDFSPIFESPAAFVVVAVGMWATRLRCPSCPQRCLSYGHDLIEGGAALLIAISMTDEGPMESCDATIALAACR